MSATQLSFALSTSSKTKTVHLLGSWDNYSGQLPLSQKDKGKWKGTFRFSTSTLKPGSRYWYYVCLTPTSFEHTTTNTKTVHRRWLSSLPRFKYLRYSRTHHRPHAQHPRRPQLQVLRAPPINPQQAHLHSPPIDGNPQRPLSLPVEDCPPQAQQTIRLEIRSRGRLQPLSRRRRSSRQAREILPLQHAQHLASIECWLQPLKSIIRRKLAQFALITKRPLLRR